MTFQQALLSANYVLDENNFDLGCYVKMDLNGNIHIYQVGENEGEWNKEDYELGFIGGKRWGKKE